MGEEEDVIGGMPSSTRKLISFHASVDGLLGVEEVAILKRIASCLAKKLVATLLTDVWIRQ